MQLTHDGHVLSIPTGIGTERYFRTEDGRVNVGASLRAA
jgi:hypothetical protein